MSRSSPPSIASKPKMNGLAVYIMSLAAMIGSYSLYLKYAVPLIEGPPQIVKRAKITPLADLPSPQQQKSHLIPYLPADAWELGECKTLLTSTGTIFFKDIEQQENGKLKVTPFTMLSGVSIDTFADPNLGNEIPTVLRSVDGAILNFDKPLAKVMQGDGKMKGARLLGEVDIFRPASKPGVNDQLHVLTSNVQIDQGKVFTLETVTFALGPHRGRGRNLMIDLEHDANAESKDFSDIKGVQRIELAFLETLRIEPSPDSNSLPLTNGIESSSGKKLFSNNRSPMQISCDGPFTFDYQQKTATFEKRVLAQQVDAFQDKIQCEKLTLMFENETASPQATIDKKSEMDDLKLKQFIAEGHPAKVTSNSKAALITGEYLSYYVSTSKIYGKSLGEQPMTLITPEYQMATRELNYVIPENKGEIGPILANGQGHLLKVGKQNETEFFVRWTKSLKTEAMAEDKNLLRILVDGEAFSKIKSDTNIRAEHLELIVRETPKIKIDEQGQPKQSTEFLPVKLVGTGNVEIASEKISGTAETLTAFWEETNRLSGLPRAEHVVAYRGTVTQQSGYGQGQQISNVQSGFREVLPQGDPRSLVVRASAQTPLAQSIVTPKRKMKFDGEQVTVKLSGHSKDAEILDLLIDGNVDLTNQSSSKSLKITGDSLRLIPQPGEENFRVQVSSSKNKPAQVLTKDFNLTGKVINLDQIANKMWIEGEGNMSLSPTTRRLPGNKKATLKKMDARWLGGMVFDGNKIYFERDVVLDVEQSLKDEAKSTTHASSQGLSITLKNPVNLKEISDEEPAKQNTAASDPVFDIQELVLTNTVSNSQRIFPSNESVARTSNVPSPNVVVEARTFDRNDTPIEQKIINVPYMKIDADSGAISAKGPGSIATYQLNDGSKKNANPFGGLTGNQNKKAPVLSLVRVNFDGSLDASSVQKEMFVTGNLRTVYSPVANWNVMMNPDNHQPSPDSVHLTCEKLHLAQWVRRASGKDSTEMIATGNARIQSDVFQATADRVSYSENSDTLTVEGTPRNDANLWYKQAPNDRNPTHLIAEKITYRVKDQATETHGIKKLNINRK